MAPVQLFRVPINSTQSVLLITIFCFFLLAQKSIRGRRKLLELILTVLSPLLAFSLNSLKLRWLVYINLSDHILHATATINTLFYCPSKLGRVKVVNGLAPRRNALCSLYRVSWAHKLHIRVF